MSTQSQCTPTKLSIFDTPPPQPPPTPTIEIEESSEIARKIAEINALIKLNTEVEEVFDSEHKAEIRQQFQPILGGVKCVVIALEGTLFSIRCDDVVPTTGAVEAFAKLRESGLKILLVANTWLKHKERTLKLLNKLGFPVEESDLFTSSDCCKIFMNKHDLKHPFLLVSDDVLVDFPDMETENPLEFDSIILGLPSTMIDYRLMTKALNILYDGHPLLVLHPTKSEKAVGSCKITAPGLYAQTLEFATDAKRFIPSKPSVGFYVEACKYAGFSPQECVMIGDCISEDVRDTKTICMKAVLVKTGKYQPQDETKYCRLSPELVVDNFYKAVQYILCATDSDPDKHLDTLEDARKKAQWMTEHDDFYTRLKAYASDDCNKSKSVCAQKVDSFVW